MQVKINIDDKIANAIIASQKSERLRSPNLQNATFALVSPVDQIRSSEGVCTPDYLPELNAPQLEDGTKISEFRNVHDWESYIEDMCPTSLDSWLAVKDEYVAMYSRLRMGRRRVHHILQPVVTIEIPLSDLGG